jgi:hypothetical protein
MRVHAQQPRPGLASATLRRSPDVLRRCGCGDGGSAQGGCEACRKKKLQRKPAAGGARLMRQEAAKEPSNEEKMKEAAKKTGEAFLETDVGKDIKKKAEDLGKDFVSGLAGKIITGAAAAGVVSYLVAKNAELPVGIPDIPLDAVRPGLKVGITYEGPVRSPSKAMVTFSFSPGSPSSRKRTAPTEKERFRAETARMAKEQADFREGLKSPQERAAEDEAFMKAYWGGMDKYGLRPLAIPGVAPEKDEKEPVRRAPLTPHQEGPASAPPVVDDVLAGSGVPLPANVRGDLEARFGHDFGRVRVHTDARAADSALAVNARAYTVGERIVFGPGQFSPASSAGLRLLAHELAHVIQNETMHDTSRRASGAIIGAVDDPLEREAETVSARVANGGDTHPTITPGER